MTSRDDGLVGEITGACSLLSRSYPRIDLRRWDKPLARAPSNLSGATLVRWFCSENILKKWGRYIFGKTHFSQKKWPVALRNMIGARLHEACLTLRAAWLSLGSVCCQLLSIFSYLKITLVLAVLVLSDVDACRFSVFDPIWPQVVCSLFFWTAVKM